MTTFVYMCLGPALILRSCLMRRTMYLRSPRVHLYVCGSRSKGSSLHFHKDAIHLNHMRPHKAAHMHTPIHAHTYTHTPTHYTHTHTHLHTHTYTHTYTLHTYTLHTYTLHTTHLYTTHYTHLHITHYTHLRITLDSTPLWSSSFVTMVRSSRNEST